MDNFYSPIKYYGSKRWFIPLIKGTIPVKEKTVFFDPFIGSGASMHFTDTDLIVIGDANIDVMKMWADLMFWPDEVKDIYRKLWNTRQEIGNDFYYFIRDLYNKYHDGTLLITLTRMCVNGKPRWNSKGEFNSAVHHGRKGITPDNFDKIVDNWKQFMDKVILFTGDYTETLYAVAENDVVYLDPPYFNVEYDFYGHDCVVDFDRFISELERLNSIGARWLMSLGGSGIKDYEMPEVPENLYKHLFRINTGRRSAFKQQYNERVELHDSLFTNFDITFNTYEKVEIVK